VPMQTQAGEIIGVLQLINRKMTTGRIPSLDHIDDYVMGFTREDEEIVRAMASQAAISVQNNRLLRSIQELFENFIQAAVLAVEQRDPTTKGHSVRVARLARTFALTLQQVTDGPYAGIWFAPEQIREIYYAGLLHDFGKVGVREHVLVKAEKLYAHEIERIRHRFEIARYSIRYRALQQKLQILLQQGPDGFAERAREIDARTEAEIRELDAFLAFVERINIPTVVPQAVDLERLRTIAATRFINARDREEPLLTPREVHRLSIARGSLDEDERREIESHAAKSYEFLRQIRWTPELQRIPEFAYMHHEKLDGSGYPRGLRGNAIPLQVRMITICDIYDALVASDRPYKPPVAPEAAIEILEEEADEGKLDGELVRIFRDYEVWKATLDALPGRH